MESLNSIIQDEVKLLIDKINHIDYLATINNWRNEQWFIEFQDKLNEISVR